VKKKFALYINMNHTRKIKNASHNKTVKTDALPSGKRKFVIGIVSVPLTPTKKYFKVCGDSYIASSHISWLKSQGIETIVIPYDTKDLEKYFKKIHAKWRCVCRNSDGVLSCLQEVDDYGDEGE
jgi:hypothetical protein